MAKYLYSIIRCVPEPSTGEFVNVAAIAGDPETGDWDVRQVENESRVRKLANAATLGAVHQFIGRIGEQIDAQLQLLEDGGDPLGEGWLDRLVRESRNVVQFSEPLPILAESADDALDTIFEHMIIDPAVTQRGFITKHKVISEVRAAYRQHVVDALVKVRVELFAGDRVHTPIDFAVANGHVLQVCQGWSFQKAGVEEVSTQVKAWGYALRSVRDGEAARIMGSGQSASIVDQDVDLAVIVAPPHTAAQQEVYEEAQQVFHELGATVTSYHHADQVGARAAELVTAANL